jgi:predicted DNA-binding transcriptional regulator YafY
VSTWRHGGTSPWLAVLQQAVVRDQVLRLRYHSFSSDELTDREVEPYFLIYYSNDWHLVGYCRLREGVRDFRAARIQAVELLPQQFERPEYVAPQQPHPRRADQEVRVWIEASAVPWARETPAYGFEREEATEGGAVFVYRTNDIRRLLPWVLSWGTSARVLSPADVAKRVRREAEALVQAYDEG